MNPERVGRDGFLRLRFARSGPRTVLAQSRFSLPLQALAPLALEDGASYLMLLNPTGGVLGGDRLVTEIVLEAGTHVCLTTTSATRVYKTTERPAILETTIRVGEEAIVEYLPDHVIPHAGSALHQSLRIEMAPRSRAIVLDAMASGRRARGERWNFREINSRMEFLVSGKPAYINSTRIAPASLWPDQLGLMKDFDYMASLTVMADGFAYGSELLPAMNAVLDGEPGVEGGASLLSRGGCMVRFLARSASDMIRMTKRLWAAARGHVLGLPPFDDRKY